MAAIKKFFQQRKIDAKFKMAGEGHKLTDDTRTRPAPGPAPAAHVPQRHLSEEKKMAADAALARMNQPKAGSSSKSAAYRAHVKQEMLAQEKSTEHATAESLRSGGPVEVQLDAHPAVSAVLFCCPMIDNELLPKDKMEAHIEGFLLSQLVEEPAMTSALMIQTLNKGSEPVKHCIETLGKYLDNIIEHPGEEKYQHIRASNKVLLEKVLALRGAPEFIQAVGFESKKIEGVDGTAEEYFVLPVDMANDLERLKSLKEILNIAEPIRPELYRDTRVFHSSSKASKIYVPDEFFNVSAEELKREAQIRKEAVEKLGMLRTKEMRERDRIRELRRYRYCLIRVRFPDGILLQGVFRATEKLTSVTAFVADCLEHDWIPFSLSNELGSKLVDDNSTLAELELVPASLIQFAYDANVLNEVQRQKEGFALTSYLKKEFMLQATSL